MDKNPKRVESGKKAAAARWGEPRVARLDDLTPPQRRLVLALIDAQRDENRTHETAALAPELERRKVTVEVNRQRNVIEAKRRAVANELRKREVDGGAE